MPTQQGPTFDALLSDYRRKRSETAAPETAERPSFDSMLSAYRNEQAAAQPQISPQPSPATPVPIAPAANEEPPIGGMGRLVDLGSRAFNVITRNRTPADQTINPMIETPAGRFDMPRVQPMSMEEEVGRLRAADAVKAQPPIGGKLPAPRPSFMPPIGGTDSVQRDASGQPVFTDITQPQFGPMRMVDTPQEPKPANDLAFAGGSLDTRTGDELAALPRELIDSKRIPVDAFADRPFEASPDGRQRNVKQRLANANAELLARSTEGFADLSPAEQLATLNAARQKFDLPPIDALPGEQTAGDVASEVATPEGLARRIPFAGIVPQIADTADVYLAAKSAERGTATMRQMEILTDFIEQQARDSRGKTIGGTATQIASDTIPFAAEFLVSGGLVPGAKKGAQKVVGRAVTKRLADFAAEQAAKTGVRGLVGRAGVGAAKIAGSTAARLPAFSPRIAEATIRNMTPGFTLDENDAGNLDFIINQKGDDFLKALSRATGDTAIEVFSEQTGAALGVIGRGAAKGAARGAEKVLRLPAGKISELQSRVVGDLMARFPNRFKNLTDVSKFLEKAGYNGILEEVGEERVGDLMRATFAVNKNDEGKPIGERLVNAIPSGKQVAGELLGFSAFPGAKAAYVAGAGAVNAPREAAIRRNKLSIEALDATRPAANRTSSEEVRGAPLAPEAGPSETKFQPPPPAPPTGPGFDQNDQPPSRTRRADEAINKPLTASPLNRSQQGIADRIQRQPPIGGIRTMRMSVKDAKAVGNHYIDLGYDVNAELAKNGRAVLTVSAEPVQPKALQLPPAEPTPVEQPKVPAKQERQALETQLAALQQTLKVGGLRPREVAEVEAQIAGIESQLQTGRPKQEATKPKRVIPQGQDVPVTPQPKPVQRPQPEVQKTAENYTSPQPNVSKQTTASVKAFLTRSDKQGLADLGYSRDDIRKMRPDEAQRIISEGRVNESKLAEPAPQVKKTPKPLNKARATESIPKPKKIPRPAKPKSRSKAADSARRQLAAEYDQMVSRGDLADIDAIDAQINDESTNIETLTPAGVTFTADQAGEARQLREMLGGGVWANDRVRIVKEGERFAGTTGDEILHELAQRTDDPMGMLAESIRRQSGGDTENNRTKQVLDAVRAKPELMQRMDPQSVHAMRVLEALESGDKDVAKAARKVKPGEGEVLFQEQLKVGDEFEIAGDKYRVVQSNEDGTILKDGETLSLDPGEMIAVDSGTALLQHVNPPSQEEEFDTSFDIAELEAQTAAEEAAQEGQPREGHSTGLFGQDVIEDLPVGKQGTLLDAEGNDLAAEAEAKPEPTKDVEGQATFEDVTTERGGVGYGEGVKRPWEMTYRELENVIRPSNREELQLSRPVLAELFPKDDPRISANEKDDPWGIYRAVTRGDEIPRTPRVDLGLRHKTSIKNAIDRGEKVPAEVLADYPDLQSTDQAGESLPSERGAGTALNAKGVETSTAEPATPSQSEPEGSQQASTNSVFRETSAGDAELYLPNSRTKAGSPFGKPELYFATTPELATGQGDNKGVLIEFDNAFESTPRATKPGAEFVAQRGGGEERVARIEESELRPHVRAVTIKKGAQGTRGEIANLRRSLRDLVKSGSWTEESQDNGDIVFRKAEQQTTREVAPTIPDDPTLLYQSDGPNAPQGKVRIDEKLPFSADNIAKVFRLPKAQSAAIEAVAKAMDIDTNRVELRKGRRTGKRLILGGKAKGAVDINREGNAIIWATGAADISTGLHELAHVARRTILNRDIAPNNRPGITDEHITIAEQWAGAEGGQWTREAEERFARGFERYMRDGSAPTKQLKGLFDTIRKWLGSIYRRIKGSNIDIGISPEMRKVYDALVSRGDPGVTIETSAAKKARQRSQAAQKLRDDVRNQRKIEEDIRNQVVQQAKEVLPVDQRGKVITQVRDARTPATLRKGMERIAQVAADAEKTQALNELAKAMKDAKAAKLRPEYQAVVDNLTEELSLRKITEKTRRALRATAEYLENNENAIIPPAVIERLKLLNQTAAAELTADEIRDVAKSVNFAIAVSKLKNQLIASKRARTQDELAERIITQMDQRVGKMKERSPRLTRRLFNKLLNRPTLSEGPKRSLSSMLLLEAGTRPEVLMEHLSPDLRDLIWEDIGVQAHHVEEKTKWEFRDALEKAVNAAAPNRMFTKRFEDWRLETLKVQMTKGQSVEMTRDEAIWLYTTLRDPTNREIIMREGITLDRTDKNYKIDPGALDEHIGPAERAISDHLFQQFNGELKNRLNSEWVKVYGVDVANVEDYVPRRVDMYRAETKVDPLQTLARMLESTLTSWGSLRARIGSGAPLRVRGALDVYMDHVDHVARIAAYLAPVTNAHAILGRSDVKQAIIERGGKVMLNRILGAIQMQTVRQTDDGGGWSNVRDATSLAGAGILGLRISPMLKNPSGLFIAASYQGGGKLLKSAMDGFNPAEWKRVRSLARKHSPYWRTRYDNFANQSTSGVTSIQRGFGRPSMPELALIPLEMSDQFGAVIRWNMAERYIEDQGTPKDAPDFNDKVAREWERSMFRSENTGHGMEMTGAIAAGRRHAAVAPWFMFSSSTSKIFSAAVRSGLAWKRGEKALALAAASGFVGAIAWAATVGAALARARGGDDEDESFVADVAKRSAQDTAKMVPIVGSLALEPIIRRVLKNNPGTYSGNLWIDQFWAAGRGASDMYAAVENWMEGKTPGRRQTSNGDRFLRGLDRFVETTSPLAGIPYGGARDLTRITMNLVTQAASKDVVLKEVKKLRKKKKERKEWIEARVKQRSRQIPNVTGYQLDGIAKEVAKTVPPEMELTDEEKLWLKLFEKEDGDINDMFKAADYQGNGAIKAAQEYEANFWERAEQAIPKPMKKAG